VLPRLTRSKASFKDSNSNLNKSIKANTGQGTISLSMSLNGCLRKLIKKHLTLRLRINSSQAICLSSVTNTIAAGTETPVETQRSRVVLTDQAAWLVIINPSRVHSPVHPNSLPSLKLTKVCSMKIWYWRKAFRLWIREESKIAPRSSEWTSRTLLSHSRSKPSRTKFWEWMLKSSFSSARWMVKAFCRRWISQFLTLSPTSPKITSGCNKHK